MARYDSRPPTSFGLLDEDRRGIFENEPPHVGEKTPDPYSCMTTQLWTLGHSTRPLEEFIGLLRAHGIGTLVDVRRFPVSRRHPQFTAEPLAKALQDAGVRYLLMPDLGGRRKSRPDSVNLGWRSDGFRGYADYMQTEAFWRALVELMACGECEPTAIMCAEAVPWHCHRSLIADALVSRGWTVLHILSATEVTPHQLTPFARIHDRKVIYPVK